MPQTFEAPHCSECQTLTQLIGSWAEGDKDLALYQCPKCKTIIMKEIDLFEE
jgi:NAD-dependent SIR2 family protein deacetylase